MMKYTCPKCGRPDTVKKNQAGKSVRCKTCGHRGRVETPVTTSFLHDFDALFMANDIYYIRALIR